MRDCIKRVIKQNKITWEELKLQIHSFGYQSYYPAQEWLKESAVREVLALSNSKKEMLLAEWKKIPRLLKRDTDAEILNQYALAVVEKVVEYASGAVARTSNWPADFDGHIES